MTHFRPVNHFVKILTQQNLEPNELRRGDQVHADDNGLFLKRKINDFVIRDEIADTEIMVNRLWGIMDHSLWGMKLTLIVLKLTVHDQDS